MSQKTPRVITLAVAMALLLAPLAAVGTPDQGAQIASRNHVEDHGLRVADRAKILDVGNRAA